MLDNQTITILLSLPYIDISKSMKRYKKELSEKLA
jgi:hypothetical protein